MSARFVSILAVAGFGCACIFAIWFATREGPSAGQATPATSEQQVTRSQGAPTAAVLEAPRPQTVAGSATPAATPAHDAQVLVTPLLDATMRLEALQPTTLRFRAQRVGSGDPATGVDLSISVVQGPGKPQLPLQVGEVGGGVYEAAFVPPGPGEFMALVTARGQSTRSVRLGVVAEPDEAGDPQGASRAISSGAGHRGGGRVTTRRGR